MISCTITIKFSKLQVEIRKDDHLLTYKSFERMFGDPTEKTWIKAHKWANLQIKLIKKYSVNPQQNER